MIKERLLELFLKREDLASDVRNYVLNNAKKNDPDSVLNTMDEFARRKRFLMNVGDVKGKILTDEIKKLGSNLTILELGCFCGYSAILMGKTLGKQGKSLFHRN
jgi:Predicted O-methyltransferase